MFLSFIRPSYVILFSWKICKCCTFCRTKTALIYTHLKLHFDNVECIIYTEKNEGEAFQTALECAY